MGPIPHEPEAFAEHVAQIVRQRHPGSVVALVGSRQLLVDGRRIDLDNLYRMVLNGPAHASEIIERYLEQVVFSDATRFTHLPLEFARGRIMPRIQPQTIFQHVDPEMVAHVPFVNGTVIVFVLDLPQMTVSITTEQMIRWGLSPDDLEHIARANLGQYRPDARLRVIESREGGRAALVAEHDGYDAARLLLSDLFDRLAPSLGGNFYVALPARDMFLALSPGPEPFVRRIHQRVVEDFRRLPYPITTDFFLVTRDGVAGTSEAA